MRAEEFIFEHAVQDYSEYTKEFNGLDMRVQLNNRTGNLTIMAYDDGQQLGQVLFKLHGGTKLYPWQLDVEPQYRGKGIAKTMYDFAKGEGFTIHRSTYQTDAGSGFWDKHRGKSATIWEATGSRESNFKKWFGKSKVVDQAGQPLRVYHGTGSDFNIFSLGHRGENQGVDQYGTGFYFAEDPSVASGYTNGESANVMPVYLSIRKPMTTTTPAFRKPIVEKLLKMAPNYLDALRDFGDVDYYGERTVLSATVPAFLDYENAIRQLNTIQHDFYRDSPDVFVSNLYQATGFDGVMVEDFGYGRMWVVFSPTQIKSATGNNGEFNPANPDITKE